MQQNELKETIARFDRWIRQLGELALELRRFEQPVLASHADSLVDDLVYQRFEIMEIHGPIIENRERGPWVYTGHLFRKTP